MSRIRALALATVALAAPVAVTATPASAQQRKVVVIKLNAGTTALTLSPGATSALTSLGVNATPITGAKALEGGSIAFNVTSGSLAGNQPAKGLIRHNGGLRLTEGAIKIDLNNLRINDGDPATLTTQIGDGERIRLAKIDFAAGKTLVSRRRLAFTDLKLTLTRDAAAALNQAFGVTAFSEGFALGTITTVARYKAKLKPKR